MRRTPRVLVAVLLIASACGGSQSPTSPTPTIPNIAGTYSSSSFWSFRFANVNTDQSVTIACPGSATLNQNGGSFTGSFLMNSIANCDSSSGQIRSGQVAQDGGVSFEIFIPGSDPNSFTALTGCSVVSGDSLLRGSVLDGRIDATATAVLQCGPDRLGFTMRMLGVR